MTAVVEVKRRVRSRQHPRGPIKKLRKFGERDRSLVIEAARRTAFTQGPCDWRERLRIRGRELAQIVLLCGPTGPHGRRGRNDANKRIDSAERIGVPTLRAAR